jgi:hypothetical protein
VLLRVVARTVPLRQWEVQRELTERLKNSLDANGADGSGVMPGPEPNGNGNGHGAHADAADPGDQRPLATPPSPTTTTTLLADVPTPRESSGGGGAPSGPATPGT